MNDHLVTMKGTRFSWHRRNLHHFCFFLMMCVLQSKKPISAFYLHIWAGPQDCLRVEVKIGLRSGLRLFGKATVRVRNWECIRSMRVLTKMELQGPVWVCEKGWEQISVTQTFAGVFLKLPKYLEFGVMNLGSVTHLLPCCGFGSKHEYLFRKHYFF